MQIQGDRHTFTVHSLCLPIFFLDGSTEFLADEDGDFSDWIELYNPTAQAINLEGWYLSDTEEDIQKWSFPALTIEAGAYVLGSS